MEGVVMPRTADLWRLPTKGARVDNLVGYDVDATDGHIGKIDHATEEADRNSVVVDTGFWIFGKKRLVPAGVIRSVDDANKRVHLSISKDRVKSAPDFDELQRSTYDDRYFDTVENYYGSYRDW
jgi:hypothetical protein